MKRRCHESLIIIATLVLLAGASQAVAQCVTQTITCPSSVVTAALSDSDCASSTAGKRYDRYRFNGSTGDNIIINVSNSQIANDVLLFTPADCNCAETQILDTPAVNNVLSYKLTATGAWEFIVRNAVPGQTSSPYTVSLSCGSQTAVNLSRRFRVDVSWKTSDGRSGQGQAVPLTGDTGYFWFFNSANVEMIVKVLDACALNNAYWVFAAGLTNVEVDLTVTDTQNGRQKSYHNAMNTPFAPIQDTSAFSCQ